MQLDLKVEAKWIADELSYNEDVSIDDIYNESHLFFEDFVSELATMIKNELEERNIKIKY